MHGKQLIENDVNATSDRILHDCLVENGPFESDSHALRKDSARDGIKVSLGYFGAINEEGGALAEDGTNVRLGDWEDGNVLGLDVGEKGDQTIL